MNGHSLTIASDINDVINDTVRQPSESDSDGIVPSYCND